MGDVMLKRIISVILLLCMVAACFSGCDDEEVKQEVTGIDIRVLTVKDTAGIALANLLESGAAGKTVNKYKTETVSSLSWLKSNMSTSEWDVAVMPTNEAAMFYKKKKGNIKILATIANGGYEILSSNSSFNDIKQLADKTIYFTERDTLEQHCLLYMLKNSGVDTENVKIEFADSVKSLSKMIKDGQAEYTVVPAAQAVELKIENTALKSVDLQATWDKTIKNSKFYSYCVVTTKEFADSHIENIDVFLKELEESVKKAASGAATLGKLAKKHGLASSEQIGNAVAKASRFAFASGEDMKTKVAAFYNVLKEVKAKGILIGKTMPAKDFYYIPAKVEE